MKRKATLCLILIIGLASFNLMGCMSKEKDVNQKSDQQESISNKNSKTNEEDTNKTENSTNDKTSKNDKVTESEQDIAVKEDDGNTKTTQESKKQIYKNKLDDIQLGLKDLADIYAGITIEMKSAASQEYERWDGALNEIYGVLKQQLSTEDMRKLKEEQIKWISDRDDEAKKASLEYKDGTAEQLVYTSSLAQTTKARCYELVEKYMR